MNQLQLVWEKDGERINNTVGLFTIYYSPNSENMLLSTLTIEDVTPEPYQGLYSCLVEHANGTENTSLPARLLVQGMHILSIFIVYTIVGT